jgi:hypothetical protein
MKANMSRAAAKIEYTRLRLMLDHLSEGLQIRTLRMHSAAEIGRSADAKLAAD